MWQACNIIFWCISSITFPYSVDFLDKSILVFLFFSKFFLFWYKLKSLFLTPNSAKIIYVYESKDCKIHKLHKFLKQIEFLTHWKIFNKITVVSLECTVSLIFLHLHALNKLGLQSKYLQLKYYTYITTEYTNYYNER